MRQEQGGQQGWVSVYLLWEPSLLVSPWSSQVLWFLGLCYAGHFTLELKRVPLETECCTSKPCRKKRNVLALFIANSFTSIHAAGNCIFFLTFACVTLSYWPCSQLKSLVLIRDSPPYICAGVNLYLVSGLYNDYSHFIDESGSGKLSKSFLSSSPTFSLSPWCPLQFLFICSQSSVFYLFLCWLIPLCSWPDGTRALNDGVKGDFHSVFSGWGVICKVWETAHWVSPILSLCWNDCLPLSSSCTRSPAPGGGEKEEESLHSLIRTQ